MSPSAEFVADAGSFQADVEDAGEGPVVDAPELVESTLKRFELYAGANDIRMPKGWPPPEHARDPGRLARRHCGEHRFMAEG